MPCPAILSLPRAHRGLPEGGHKRLGESILCSLPGTGGGAGGGAWTRIPNSYLLQHLAKRSTDVAGKHTG